jgi:RNA polymerase sigma factor (sigma-70 family)
MQQLLEKSSDFLTDPSQRINDYYHYLLSYALSRVRDKEVAKDLVQESFLAALENVHTFKNKSSEKTWLVAILKNKIIDNYRKTASESRHLTLFNPPVCCEMFPAQHELLPLLDRAVQKLPELWQSVFNMKHVQDQPSAVICKKLNLTASNYWVISHRTKSKLRVSLINYV